MWVKGPPDPSRQTDNERSYCWPVTFVALTLWSIHRQLSIWTMKVDEILLSRRTPSTGPFNTFFHREVHQKLESFPSTPPPPPLEIFDTSHQSFECLNFSLKSDLRKQPHAHLPSPRKVLLLVSDMKCLNFKTLEYRDNVLSTWMDLYFTKLILRHHNIF